MKKNKFLAKFGQKLTDWILSSMRFDAHNQSPPAPCIIAILHEELLAYASYLAGTGQKTYVTLVSKNKDGDLVTEGILTKRHIQAVRGSSSKGGLEALNQLLKIINDQPEKHISFTVDGPRGPRREVKPGIVLLAKRSGLPLYVGRCHYKGWRANKSWDKHLFPKPFTKLTTHFSEPIYLNRQSNTREVQAQLEKIIADMDPKD